MRVIDVVQGSPMWFEARKGLPTASNFDKILTPKTCKPSSSQDDYINELIADLHRITPWTEREDYKSAAMQNGVLCEPEARRWYELEMNCEVREVGLCITEDGRFGASPDGLVGDEGGLELKCPSGKTQVKYLLHGGLLDDYKCQVHGCLIVTGRPWWDIVSYCPGLPPVLLRVTPNEFTLALGKELERFHVKYQIALDYVQQLGKAGA